MAERTIVSALKAEVPMGTGGSNPSLPAEWTDTLLTANEGDAEFVIECWKTLDGWQRGRSHPLGKRGSP